MRLVKVRVSEPGHSRISKEKKIVDRFEKFKLLEPRGIGQSDPLSPLHF